MSKTFFATVFLTLPGESLAVKEPGGIKRAIK